MALPLRMDGIGGRLGQSFEPWQRSNLISCPPLCRNCPNIFSMKYPMSKICAQELAPGDGAHTDHEMRDYIRANIASTYHPAGTCAMGGDVARSASGYDSVVDPLLRVRGVAGLRIVDASVMPTLPRGNTNAPTIAIAERAADLIAGRAPLVPLDPEAAPAPTLTG